MSSFSPKKYIYGSEQLVSHEIIGQIIKTLSPGLPSYMSTDQPRFASVKAAKQPTGPAPTTMAFLVGVVIVRREWFSPRRKFFQTGCILSSILVILTSIYARVEINIFRPSCLVPD